VRWTYFFNDALQAEDELFDDGFVIVFVVDYFTFKIIMYEIEAESYHICTMYCYILYHTVHNGATYEIDVLDPVPSFCQFQLVLNSMYNIN